MNEKIDIEGIIWRLKAELGIPDEWGSDGLLAQRLMITTAAISKWRQRGAVPLEIIARECKRNLPYIIFGIRENKALYAKIEKLEADVLKIAESVKKLKSEI